MRKHIFGNLIYSYVDNCVSAHFSENWGYMCLSPIVAGNLFSLIFGINFDTHSRPPSIPTPSSSARSLLDHTPFHSSPLTSFGLSYLSRYVILSPPLEILPRAVSPPLESDHPLCLSGSQCYISAIYLTTFATFSAIFLSAYAGYRDRYREMNRPAAIRRMAMTVEPSRCFEEDEEEFSGWER